MTSQAANEAEKMPDNGMKEIQMQSSTDKSNDMKQTMQAGMEAMSTLETTGDIDKDFAMLMKVHHQQALDMAKMELAHGKSPVMKAMAKKIITAQKREIAQFDLWLAKQKYHEIRKIILN
jgi:uncharacterized protein (DUF305 family)